jgi:hypothetical protein
MDLDSLAEWLERHPEIAEVTVTEVITTITDQYPEDDDVVRSER